MKKQLNIVGKAGVAIGILSGIFIMYPGIQIALPFSILGMLTGSYYVYQDTTHQISEEKLSLGMITILLSSIPVLFVLGIILYKSFIQ